MPRGYGVSDDGHLQVVGAHDEVPFVVLVTPTGFEPVLTP